jgi:hydroxyacylglutathione hydrolase
LRITDRISLVGSGQLGFGLTNPLDCNVYLLDGGSELALIDAGVGIEPERILARIHWSGYESQRIAQVFLTHGHADHSVGAAFWRDHLGCAVVAPERCAEALREADEAAISLDRARAAGGYPEDFTMPPIEVDQRVSDGERVKVGRLELLVLEVPGHSEDHVAYLCQSGHGEDLFCGDLLTADGRVMLLAAPDCSPLAYSSSVARLATRELAGIFPGHGRFSLNGAQRAVSLAAADFRQLRVPQSA